MLNIITIEEFHGGLRVIASGADHEQREIIKKTEKRSCQTCEVCGKRGRLQDIEDHLYTRCDEHSRKVT